MNDTLKAAGRIGAELGAAKAEVERLREELRKIANLPMDRCSTENDYRLAGAKAMALAAISQQAEPCGGCGNTDESKRCIGCVHPFSKPVAICETMQRPKAECGCPDCGSSLIDWPKAEPAPAQDERDAHQYAFEVGGTEDGNYILMPEELDEVVRRAREPFEDVLRSLACSLCAGGYNAPTVDPTVFEQKIRWGIDQLTRPAQTEQQATVKECLTVQPVAYAVFAENGNVACFSTRRDHPSLVAFESDGHSVVSLAPIAQTAQQGDRNV